MLRYFPLESHKNTACVALIELVLAGGKGLSSIAHYSDYFPYFEGQDPEEQRNGFLRLNFIPLQCL